MLDGIARIRRAIRRYNKEKETHAPWHNYELSKKQRRGLTEKDIVRVRETCWREDNPDLAKQYDEDIAAETARMAKVAEENVEKVEVEAIESKDLEKEAKDKEIREKIAAHKKMLAEQKLENAPDKAEEVADGPDA